MDRLPPLNAVRVFEAAARHESFNRAAKELHVTPSAVSHQVKSLEEFLGIKLFERRGRQVALTNVGLRYLPEIRNALEQVRSATEGIILATRPEALTISVAPSFANGWLLPRLAKFQIERADIEVRIITSVSLVDFTHSDVDVGIRTGKGEWPGLISHRILSEELALVCSPRYLDDLPDLRRLQELRNTTLLHVLPRMGQWRSWFNAVGLTDVDPDAGPKLSNAATLIEAAISGLGVAIIDRRMIEAHLQDGRLMTPFEIALPSEHDYYLVFPESAAAERRITVFRDWILSEAELDARPTAGGELEKLMTELPNRDEFPK